MLPPKRRRVSHPQLASPTLPLPLVPASMPPPPRTPSPQVQVKIEGSFFSPSFFSSPTRSSSPPPHSDDERMLSFSSPPTSPFPVLSPKMVAPVPLRPLANRLSFSMQNPLAGYTPTQPPQKLPRPSRTHPCPDGPGFGPSTLEPRPHPSADKVAVKDTNGFPPPADIPPRARTPPSPDGPVSGSRQGTPQPRPVRPDHGMVRSCVLSRPIADPLVCTYRAKSMRLCQRPSRARRTPWRSSASRSNWLREAHSCWMMRKTTVSRHRASLLYC
ncbi:hypothetical protein OH76DRAFT_1411166 [Lentinus brumalis]|uniref:Uncharacterized protein n=1 Tax=Lentinus brumalis TaxID=2498619 RepID=A0A371CQ27_9APHY|nr:hypothetical protein OH76DRAFT_1411166 [Polyporus brumalis]